jgi:ligand-binding sensor domain-containing protein
MTNTVRFLVLAVFAVFQTIKVNCQSHRVIHYSLAEGLPSSQVLSLMEDKLGYLWIGTFGGGLVRFDGRDFVTYTKKHGLIDNDVKAIAQDKSGNILVGTARGVSRFDGNKFVTVRAQFGSKSLNNDIRIRQMLLFNDSLFLISRTGKLCLLSDDSIKLIETTYPIVRLLPDTISHQLYFLTSDRILRKRGQSKFKVVLPLGVSIGDFVNFKGENLLSSSDGFYRISNDSAMIKVYPFIKSRSLISDPIDSVVWITSNYRLKKIDWNGVETPGNVLLDEIIGITCYQQDSEGGIWIGTFTGGLWHIVNSEFDRISTTKNNSAAIFPIERLKRENSLLLGTYGGGLLKIAGNGSFSSIVSEVKSKNFIYDMANTPEGIWIATAGGLGKYIDRSIKWYNDAEGKPLDSALSLDIDSKKQLWVGRMGRKINMVRNDSVFEINTTGFDSYDALSLKYSEFDSALYIGSVNGVYALRNGKIAKVDIPEININGISGLSIYKERHLVIGTADMGIALMNIETREVTTITEEDGLLSDLIYFVKADADDLWIGTPRGINRIRLGNGLTISSIDKYNNHNGFTGIEANSNGFYIDDSIKVFASSDGIYKYIELKEKPKAKHGMLHLEDVSLFYGEYPSRDFGKSLSNDFFKVPINPSFPPNRNHVSFKFNLVSKSLPANVRFKTKLDNFEELWTIVSDRRDVIYSSLPPGDYVFRVMAISAGDGKPLDELQYPFTINSPFYKTLWFQALALILIILIVIALFYFKVQQKVRDVLRVEKIRFAENQSLRQEIARDFHDEMGNHLAKIVSYVDVLKINPEGVDIHQILGKIEHSVKFINFGTRDFIWTINPKNNNATSLFFYVRDFADKFFRNSSIMFRSFYDLGVEWNISYKSSREIILIFKEALTNALKHSKARNVSFSLIRKDNLILFALHDDGVGFSQNDHRSSGGLTNIEYRAKKISGRLHISTKPDQGTQIELALDISHIK